MKSFKTWSVKFISDNTSYGDIAREVRKGKCIPTGKSKEVTMNYLIDSKMWNASAIATISEMLDLYYEEVISRAKSWIFSREINKYPIQVTRWNESKEDTI